MLFSTYTYRFMALILAFLMFFSSVAFSLDKHYCQGQLKSVALFVKAKNCHELAAGVSKCKHHQTRQQKATTEGCEVGKKDCCQNNTLFFHLDQNKELPSSAFLINESFKNFVGAFVFSFFNNDLLNKENTALAFRVYKPPLIPRDIPILIQSFLL